MKTYKNLYSQICSFENLYQAFRLARRGKRDREAVAAFEFNLEGNLLRLQAALHAQTYQPGSYHNFYILEPKRRLVSAAPFPDRVVHHALCQVIEPIWEARFFHHSYACRVGKGTHAALDQCQAWVRQYRYTFPGDDLFALLRPRGLPIGNLTSQFWANVYLHELDMFVKHELKCAAYLRYMDDVVLFSNEKSQLHAWKAAIGEFLGARLRLLLHPRKSFIFPTGIGIDFCGFILFPTHRRLRRNVTDLTPQPPSRNGKGGHHPPLSWSHLTTLGNKVSQNGKGEERPLLSPFRGEKRVGVMREV